MLLKAVALVGAAYLLGFFSEDVPDTQTETGLEVQQSVETGLEAHQSVETGLEVPQPVNRGTGIETQFRTSGLEKRIINELVELDGKTLPEDYESRLFTLSRGSINTDALSDDELEKVNQIFGAIKDHMFELFSNKYTVRQELIKAADIESVYVYSFSHKAATLECLTSNEICQPPNAQHLMVNAERTTQSNDEGSIFDDFKKMLSFEWILEHSKVGLAGYQESDNALALLGIDFSQRKMLEKRASDFVSLSRVINKNEAFPTMGFRAVFVMTGTSKENVHIVSTGRSYTHKFDAERLSIMLRTIPGKKISMRTGLAKELNKEKQY
ncbi:hypothetical protein [Endozoicomonas sp. 8E]|uniref:hypothetical protein n=1 Tax=Endozoicomonas sp. 8E TaxID=3035692 RepID=UPI00293939E4|nr:hypothetical protein [Endozoicomonas sp. 8E]WOG29434.1 hypothetical protein P6910_07235 [Endozoicomonas sp. 8E]